MFGFITKCLRIYTLVNEVQNRSRHVTSRFRWPNVPLKIIGGGGGGWQLIFHSCLNYFASLPR